jgi:3-oxoacyl-[acyl-carrier-protein] synthase III
MRIKSVELLLPERPIANDDVADRVRFRSRGIFAGRLEVLAGVVLKLLEKAGARRRFWSDQRSKPIDYIAEVANRAIAGSGVAKSDIELVVFVGVDRGFYEPANAYFVADCLGLHSAQCFDIVDACNGWSRALQVCDALFQTGQYRNALLVNGEFPMFERGPVNPRLFEVESLKQLEHRFPAFTLGEGATATVVAAEPDGNWEYKTLSSPGHADLCTVTCREGARFSRDSYRLDVDGPGQFVSFGADLIAEGSEYAVKVLQSLSASLESISAVFPHAVSQPAVEAAALKAGASQLVYGTFPQVGNLISASVPAGIALARDEGRIKSGDVGAGWVGSAGMVFSAYTFTV